MLRRLISKFTWDARKSFSTTHQSNVKVTVLGAAGGIGQPLSLLLKQCPLINDLALYDIVNTPGVTADIAHINTPARVIGFHGKENLDEALHQSDVVIISAGMARKPGMSRDDLFDSNASIVYEMGTAIAKSCPLAIVGLITNPVNSCIPVLSEVLMKENKFDPRRIIGITTLDEVRAATFIGMANNVDPSSISVPVICGHSGITIIPLFSQCHPRFNIPDELAKKIIEDVREAGTRVVEAKAGNGSATISMAWAGAAFTVKLVKALRGERDVVTCAYVLSDICDTKYFALPIALGRCGIEKDYGLPAMNDCENKLLRDAIPELKKNVQKGIDFVQKGRNEKNKDGN